MSNIKPLEWTTRLDYEGNTVVQANPEDLKYAYYIDCDTENNQYSLSIMEENGDYIKEQSYPSLELAKSAAEKHYMEIINGFLITLSITI